MRLAKYNVYRYIGCIIDQSNWSGPFSLVVMTPDLESSDLGSRPGRVVLTSAQILHICFQQIKDLWVITAIFWVSEKI